MDNTLVNNYLAFFSLTFEVRNLEFGIIYLKLSGFYATQNNLNFYYNQHNSLGNIRRQKNVTHI